MLASTGFSYTHRLRHTHTQTHKIGHNHAQTHTDSDTQTQTNLDADAAKVIIIYDTIIDRLRQCQID